MTLSPLHGGCNHSRPCLDAILINHSQRSETVPLGVVMSSKAKCEEGLQPTMIIVHPGIPFAQLSRGRRVAAGGRVEGSSGGSRHVENRGDRI